MPTERTVMLLIKAQNATGEALKAVQGDLDKTGEAATKMGNKTEKGFMQGIKGAMSFLRQIRGIYFIIAGLVVGILVKLAQPVNEYVKTLNKMSETANLTGKDISRLAGIIEKQGRAIGMGTLALATATGDVEQASNSYVSIMGSLKGMYEKMLPAMDNQDTILKRLGVDYDGLYRAMQGPIELIEVFGNKGLTARDAYVLFGEKFAEVLKLLNMSPEALKKMQNEMDAATAKTLANKEKMKEYEQAVKDLHEAWDNFRAKVQPVVLKVVTEGLQGVVDIIQNIQGIPEKVKGEFEAIKKSGFWREVGGAFKPGAYVPPVEMFTPTTMPAELVGPPAPAPPVSGVLPPEEVMAAEVEALKKKVSSVTGPKGTSYFTDVMFAFADKTSMIIEAEAATLEDLAKKIRSLESRYAGMGAKLDSIQGNM